jgi:hypothetical protein
LHIGGNLCSNRESTKVRNGVLDAPRLAPPAERRPLRGAQSQPDYELKRRERSRRSARR